MEVWRKRGFGVWVWRRGFLEDEDNGWGCLNLIGILESFWMGVFEIC